MDPYFERFGGVCSSRSRWGKSNAQLGNLDQKKLSAPLVTVKPKTYFSLVAELEEGTIFTLSIIIWLYCAPSGIEIL